MADDRPPHPPDADAFDDEFGDEPERDAWDEADRAWEAKWADTPEEADAPEEAAEEPPLDPPAPGYRSRRATVGGTTDAYGDGMRAAGPHLGLGLQIGVSMLFFVGLGLVADRWLGTSPWGVIVGAALGMAGIVALVVRVSNEANKKR